MDSYINVMEDECAEISVNTEEFEPRGTFAENEQNKMTSFETLVHTALALEEDPRDEHSYAYSDKKMSQESANKDHCYYSGSKHTHRKIQSLSDENLVTPAQPDMFEDKYFMLPHHRSNDSALDVTGFDTISDKCLSFENIHVKTVDVFTENCILPGVSDPDLSRMTIQSQADVDTSFSLPNSPPTSVNDHSYSFKFCSDMEQNKASEQNRLSLLKDHAYNNLRKTCDAERNQFLLDHSYGNRKRRDSLPATVGIKRGRSNDDLSLLGSYCFKRKDFTKSPFLDHTYQSVELQSAHTKHQSSKRNTSVAKINRNMLMSNIDIEMKAGNEMKNEDTSQNFNSFKQLLFPNRLLLDHTYEEITDSTADMPVTDFISQARGPVSTKFVCNFGDVKTDVSDHSYVIKKHFDPTDSSDISSSELSDSGTESLNDVEDVEMSSSFGELADSQTSKWHTEHPYFKTWRSNKKS